MTGDFDELEIATLGRACIEVIASLADHRAVLTVLAAARSSKLLRASWHSRRNETDPRWRPRRHLATA